MYLGFDRSGYPGDDVMQSLWDSVPDLTYVCLYLAPAPSHGNRAWMDAAPSLQSMGWGLLPTYVGQQVIGAGSHTVTADQGVRDAQDASALAGAAGIGNGGVIYLDIENGGQMPQNQVQYVTAWMQEVYANTPYLGGVYCSSVGTAQQVTDNTIGFVSEYLDAVPTWCYHPISTGPNVIDLDTEQPRDPAGCGFAGALAWQYRMSLNGSLDVTWTDRDSGTRHRLNTVDLDTSSVADPAFPQADRSRDAKPRRFLAKHE
jgi:hypothetical protein